MRVPSLYHFSKYFAISTNSFCHETLTPVEKKRVIQRVKLRVERAFYEKKHGFTVIFHALLGFLRVVSEISHG